MKREYKVLSHLWRRFDRAPRAYLFCDDPAVLGADFFVMERRRGEVVREGFPDRCARIPRWAVASPSPWSTRWPTCTPSTPSACGLADLGRRLRVSSSAQFPAGPSGGICRNSTIRRRQWTRSASDSFAACRAMSRVSIVPQ
jgi:hypothetical protein